MVSGGGCGALAKLGRRLCAVEKRLRGMLGEVGVAASAGRSHAQSRLALHQELAALVGMTVVDGLLSG